MKFKKLSIKQQEIRFGQSLKVVPIRNKGVKYCITKILMRLEIEVSLTYETLKAPQRLFKLQEKNDMYSMQSAEKCMRSRRRKDL